jgi:hypothetical protein
MPISLVEGCAYYFALKPMKKFITSTFRPFLVISCLTAFFLGCSPKEPEITQTADFVPSMPDISLQADSAEAPEALAATEPGSLPLASEDAPVLVDNIGIEDASELDRLNFALHTYYEDSSRPAITSFEPLVKARLIKRVPVAPPGMKYIIDPNGAMVLLVKEQ